MREYLAGLEARIEKSLKLWKKTTKIENGEVCQLAYQFEQAHIFIDVFWLDGDEGINVECRSPRLHQKHEWSGLTEDTADRVMDLIGNYAQKVQYRDHYKI